MNRRHSPGWTWRDGARAVGFVLVSLAVLGAGLGATTRELTVIPARQFVQDHADTLDSDDPAERQAVRAKALSLFESLSVDTLAARDLERWAGLALFEARDAIAQQRAETAAESLDEASTLLRRSLAGNPVRPLPWAALAEVTVMNGGDPEEAFGYLRTSYDMAPIDPNAATYRLSVAVLMSSSWDVAFLRSLRQDFGALLRQPVWKPDAREFQTQAARNPALIRLAEILVRRDSAFQDRWDRHARRIAP